MTTSKKPLPPPINAPKAAPEPTPAREFSIISGKIDAAQRVLLYGRGGIGKSSLAAMAPSPVFIDIESGTGELDVPRVEGIETFADLRTLLQSPALDAYETIVLDSATKAEELAIAHTLAHVKHEKGRACSSIEDYGFGKGYQHVYDTFLLLLSDLDKQVRAGRNVILIAHECITDHPNPFGDDFIRYEPHLQSPKSGKASTRNRVVQWADHVLFIGYDVIAEDGKGKGSGTRTVYTSELPSHIAKSRRAEIDVPFTGPRDGAVWNTILGGKK